MLRILNQSIKMERYCVFTNSIRAGMKKQFESTLKSITNPPSEPSLDAMVRCVEEVTKVTHLQIVAYMTLFNEHEGEFLTKNQVLETLEFLKGLLFACMMLENIERTEPGQLKSTTS
jgi:hypothetical protein